MNVRHLLLSFARGYICAIKITQTAHSLAQGREVLLQQLTVLVLTCFISVLQV